MTETAVAPATITDERLTALHDAASSMTKLGYTGRWRWYIRGGGEEPSLRDSDADEVIDVATRHRHFRMFHETGDGTEVDCPEGGYGPWCRGLGDGDGGPVEMELPYDGEDGKPEPCTESTQAYPVLRHQEPRYHLKVIGPNDRPPARVYLEQVDAATVLALVDEVRRLRAALASTPC